MTRLINADGRDVTQDTLRGIEKAILDGNMNKAAAIPTASGLSAYNLKAPWGRQLNCLTCRSSMVIYSVRGKISLFLDRAANRHK